MISLETSLIEKIDTAKYFQLFDSDRRFQYASLKTCEINKNDIYFLKYCIE